MKTAVLYLGLPKTATTAHQNAIYQHRKALLRDHAILYPGAAANHTDLLCPMFLPDPRTHVTLQLKGISDPDAVAAYQADCFGRLERELAQPGWDRVILSAEGLVNLAFPALKQLGEWLLGYVDRLETIYWLRHPVSYTTSVLQQMLKGGATIEGCMNEPSPVTNYHRRVENAVRAFGREAVSVYRFEDALTHPLGPVGAFCAQVGIPEPMARVIAADAQRENVSMSMMAGHLLDALNRHWPMFVDGRVAPERYPGDYLPLMEIGGPRFDVDAATRAEICRRARPELDWLVETFGGPFYDDVTQGLPPASPPPQIPPREMLDPLVPLVHAGLQAVRR